jgi:hypothetical protein
MRPSIWGDLYQDENQIADILIEQIDKSQHICFKPNKDKTYGIDYDKNFNIRKGGIYCIYNNKKIVYVGQTKLTVGKRLSYFCAVITGRNAHSEDHPGARKMRFLFEHVINKSPIDQLSVRYVELDKIPMNEYVTLESIEQAVIRKLRPKFNSEIINCQRIDVSEIV